MASIYRRGRMLWGRVQRQGQDLRQSLKTTSRRVAEKRLREWLEELDRVSWGEKPRRTFDEAMLKFIDEHLPTLKPKAAQRYRVSAVHLTNAFEGRFIDDLGSAEFMEFETTRRRAGAKPPTIRRDFACLSSMMSCCIDWEWIDANPVGPYLRRRKKRGLKESPPRRRYLRHEEEAALLKAAQPHVAKAIAVAIDTGLRKEEQFSLQRQQIAHGRIALREGTKNSKPRDVPLLPRAAEILAKLPAHLGTDYVFVNARPPGRRAVDPASGKRLLTPGRQRVTRYRTMDRGLKGAAERAGLKDVRWHDLRRTCGVRLLRDHGMSMEQVSQWLGHSSVLVTQRSYAFLEVEDLERKLAENREAEASKQARSAQRSRRSGSRPARKPAQGGPE